MVPPRTTFPFISILEKLLYQGGTTSKSKQSEGNGVHPSTIALVLAGAVAATAGATVNTVVGLRVVALALLATLNSLGLRLEVIEEGAEISDIGGRLDIHGSLYILKSRELDPKSPVSSDSRRTNARG